jgi:flagellar protein FliS
MDTGEIAERLQAIYVFQKKTLIEARVQRSAEKIGQVVALLSSLREAWARLAEQAAAQAPASA